MFKLFQRSARRICTIYAIHKSGPADEQTKFLINEDGGWEWQWSSDFEPVPNRETARRMWREGSYALDS